jgi:hypothetical protein
MRLSDCADIEKRGRFFRLAMMCVFVKWIQAA